MSASGLIPRSTSSGKISAALPSRPTEIGTGAVARCMSSASSMLVGAAVEIARLQPLLDPALLAFDRDAMRAGHHRGERLRAAHAAKARGQDPAARADRRHNAGGPSRRRSRRCPARCPGCRYRSTIRPSSGRTSSGPCDRARGNGPRSPSAAPGSNWRSAPAAHPAWVRNTPTGLPDWTSRVSSPSSRFSVATIAS